MVDIDAVQEKLAIRNRHHAAEGSGQGGLATTHSADHSHQFTGLDAEADAVQGVAFRSFVLDAEPPGFQASLAWLWRFDGLFRVADQRLAAQQFLHPFQAHLAGLECVEGEAQQGCGKHQLLHVEDQGNQASDREAAFAELAAAQGKQQQQGNGGQAFQQREEGASGSGQADGAVAVVAVALGEGVLFGGFLPVNLDGADAGQVLLDQIAQSGQVLLLPALLLHHPAAEQAHHREHQRIRPDRRKRQPGVNRQHRGQRQAVRQQRVGQTQDCKTQQSPDVLHIAGGSADHIAAAGGLHPGGLLAEHVIEQALPQFDLHLAANTEDQLPRQQAHTAHGGCQQDDPAGLAQNGVVGEPSLEFVHHPTHLHRDGHAEDVDHHQGDGAHQHGFAMRAQVAADQIQAHGRHAGLFLGGST